MNKSTVSLAVMSFVLAGCSQAVKYNPDDFVNPNQVVTQKVKVPALPEPKVKATYGEGNDPLVVKAYEQYTKTGQMKTIHASGWLTYPYSSHTKPVIQCQPLRLCVVQLESGEQLNSVNVGDSVRWKIGEFLTGEGKTGSVSITIKPTETHIATDLIISTNKRTYNIGLVSKSGVSPSILRFWYPEETLRQSVLHAQAEQQKNSQVNMIASTTPTQGTKIDVNHLNFNYSIHGDSPVWKPTRVFDDSNKTFIEMPGISSRFNLPVLYLAKHGKLNMVNYRYRAPYFVVDGLFSKAWLISGKGDEQIKVEIDNKNMTV